MFLQTIRKLTLSREKVWFTRTSVWLWYMRGTYARDQHILTPRAQGPCVDFFPIPSPFSLRNVKKLRI